MSSLARTTHCPQTKRKGASIPNERCTGDAQRLSMEIWTEFTNKFSNELVEECSLKEFYAYDAEDQKIKTKVLFDDDYMNWGMDDPCVNYDHDPLLESNDEYLKLARKQQSLSATIRNRSRWLKAWWGNYCHYNSAMNDTSCESDIRSILGSILEAAAGFAQTEISRLNMENERMFADS